MKQFWEAEVSNGIQLKFLLDVQKDFSIHIQDGGVGCHLTKHFYCPIV